MSIQFLDAYEDVEPESCSRMDEQRLEVLLKKLLSYCRHKMPRDVEQLLFFPAIYVASP